jgi:ribosomal protein S18 acetylase RimI-like enzyme
LGHVWLIDEGGAPAGYAVMTLGYSLEFGGRDAFVDELYIRPAYRRRGLGRRAVEVVATYCRDTGVQALHLEVGRENEAAQALYRQAGFADRRHWLLTRRLDAVRRGPGE